MTGIRAGRGKTLRIARIFGFQPRKSATRSAERAHDASMLEHGTASLSAEERSARGRAKVNQARSGLHRHQQVLGAEEVQNAPEVVGKHMQAHFRAHLWERLGEEMGMAHPGLERPEGVLDRLTASMHRLGLMLQTSLGGFEHGLMLPAANAPLDAGGALGVPGTVWASRTPVGIEGLALLDVAIAPDQLLPGRTAVGIRGRVVAERLAGEQPFGLVV